MKPPAFQFYADDFLAGTITFNNEQRGLYIALLCLQWSQGKVALEDAESLSPGMSQDKLQRVLAKFTTNDLGEMQNARLESERTKQEAFRVKCSTAGRRSAEGRLKVGSTNLGQTLEPKGNSPVSSLQSPISCNTHTHTPRASRWPTLAQTKDYASIIGFDESEAELFWHHFESAGWIDKNGQPVMKWQSKLVTWNVSSRARAREAAHLAKPERAPRRPEQNQTQEIINVPNL